MADLITLDEYKLLEGINSTQYDDKFETLITSVSQLVRTYCNNEFDAYVGSPGYEEKFNIQWDTYVVQLKQSPVISVIGVFERSSQGTEYTELFADGNGSPAQYSWYLDRVSDSIFRTNESGAYRNFPRGVGSVKVVYQAGYATIPADLQLAVGDIITYYHNNEHKERQTIGTATREGVPSSSIRSDPGFPDHIRRVLDMYRIS